MNTFCIVSKCKTAVYFSRCLIQRLPNNTAVLAIGIAIASILRRADRLRLTSINRDRARLYMIHSFIQYFQEFKGFRTKKYKAWGLITHPSKRQIKFKQTLYNNWILLNSDEFIWTHSNFEILNYKDQFWLSNLNKYKIYHASTF